MLGYINTAELFKRHTVPFLVNSVDFFLFFYEDNASGQFILSSSHEHRIMKLFNNDITIKFQKSNIERRFTRHVISSSLLFILPNQRLIHQFIWLTKRPISHGSR